MSQETLSNTGIVQSLQQVGSNHAASCERSYNSDPTIYTTLSELTAAWHAFHADSRHHNRRRAVMRTYATTEVVELAARVLPLEAALPLGREYLVWLGANQHSSVSLERPVHNLPEPVQLAPQNYCVDTFVQSEDIVALQELWQQFGWTAAGVQLFVEQSHNPVVVLRDLEQRVVGAMIAEAQSFGTQVLVELTELAVAPANRGQGLASVLIRELAQHAQEVFGRTSVVFGEYNITTQAAVAAARAGQRAAQTPSIAGVLHDHVSIETGAGNRVLYPWDTQWLHHFLVMYQPLD